MHGIQKNSRKIFLLGLLSLLLLSKTSSAFQSQNLTIFAEQNMALALTEIARIYSQKSNVAVSINFNSPQDLINEIEFGEPADIFVSGHQGWIESLHQKGLVDVYNIGYIAQDKLVLATLRSNHTLPPELLNKSLPLSKALKNLDKNRSTLILDNEGSSSGYSAKNFVRQLPLHNLKLFSKIIEDKTPFLNIVKSNNQNYALLLASQVQNNSDFQVLSLTKSNNVFYQALVIAGDNMEIARKFLKFLKSNVAKSVFEKNGFITN